MPAPRIRSSFTLIEMLVVIAIISILAAMLSPSLMKARENALKTVCVNNVRQLGTATLMYEQDFNAMPVGGWCIYPVIGFMRREGGGTVPELYRLYLGGKVTDSEYYGMPDSLSGDPALSPLLVCPSNPRDWYDSVSYSLFGTSAVQKKMTVNRMEQLSRRNPDSFRGRAPALWADRCNLRNDGNNGGLGKTCHYGRETDANGERLPAGGNVGGIDGSCRWLDRLNGVDNDPDLWIVNGGWVGDHIAIPPTAIFMDVGYAFYPHRTTIGTLGE
ncbi:MAG: DUF1559 domain-containing protein [Planctomycetes bacterium]|nr:DUF1559 domain-containing protein [Planctomycetota bacterium]